jgi:hypothetical protein
VRLVWGAGVDGLWAVHFQPEGVPYEDSLAYHAFLLLSVGGETKVLRTGEELDEVKPSEVDFALNTRTVSCGNLLNNSRIVQVSPRSLLRAPLPSCACHANVNMHHATLRPVSVRARC